MILYKTQLAGNTATYQLLARQFQEKFDIYRNSRGKYRKGYDDICSQIYLYLNKIFSSSVKSEVKIIAGKKEFSGILEGITRFDASGPCLKLVQNGVITLVGIESLSAGVQKFEVGQKIITPSKTLLQKVK